MSGSKPLKPTLKRRKTPGVALLRPWPRPCLLGKKILGRYSFKSKVWPGLRLVWRDPYKGPGLFLYLVLPVEFKFFKQSGPKIRLPALAPILAFEKNLTWSLFLRKEKGSPPEEKALPGRPFPYAQKETLLREIFTFREKTEPKAKPLFVLPQRTFAEKTGAKVPKPLGRARPGAPTLRKSLKLLRFPGKRGLPLLKVVIGPKEHATDLFSILSLRTEPTLRKNLLLMLYEGPFPAGGRNFPEGETPEMGLAPGGQAWLPRAPEKGLGPSPSFPLKAFYQEPGKPFSERLVYRKEPAPPLQREVIKEMVQKEISLSRVLPPREEAARPQKASFSAKEIRNLAEALFEPFMERWRKELERRGFLHVRFP